MQLPYSESALRLEPPAIKASNKEDPDIISFAEGNPERSFFPLEETNRLLQEMLMQEGTIALQYSGAEGFEELRDLIAKKTDDTCWCRNDTRRNFNHLRCTARNSFINATFRQ